MTAHALSVAQRRGACPGLSAPMPTGDGLLVRLLPIGPMPLTAFAALCAAARRHGNGIVEVTGRGSLQVRGLSAASAPRFADAIRVLNIAAADGVPVLSNPLAGLDPAEIVDAAALATALRRTLADGPLGARLAPKVSVAIDGGGTLALDDIAADVRLQAEPVSGDAMLRVGVGGTGADAAQLGLIAARAGVDAATRLLEVIARRGRDARARDVLAAEGPCVFRAAISDLLIADPPRPAAPRPYEAIGRHRLRDGLLACGLGLAFGHAAATALDRLIESAAAAGAAGIRAAPARALLVIGLTERSASAVAADAERFGLVVRADDPRRRVVACAGAPICASAHIAARAIAPLVAELAGPQLDGRFVHISGCAKGCAHVGVAAVTAVGGPVGCALVAGGTTRDAPFATVAVDQLPAAIARYVGHVRREVDHV